jgi:Tfp pilus assembly protein PilN
MLRINLLPREVLDRHRYEGWYRYVFIVSIGSILIVLVCAVALFLAVNSKNDELQFAQEMEKQYTEQGKAFDVFEKKEIELDGRQALVQHVLADRMNLGKVAEEVSLVLPDEVWLDSMTIGETDGLTFVANTPRSGSQSTNISYKSVAKTLVRLNQLPDVTDVWLTSASNNTWGSWDAATEVDTTTPVVKFATSAKVINAPASTTTVQAGE